jgi:hypothetical protein
MRQNCLKARVTEQDRQHSADAIGGGVAIISCFEVGAYRAEDVHEILNGAG